MSQVDVEFEWNGGKYILPAESFGAGAIRLPNNTLLRVGDWARGKPDRISEVQSTDRVGCKIAAATAVS